MCGFLGIVNLGKKKINQKDFDLASKLIQHRGPDDKHFYIDENINISFYRLSLRDLSNAGRQPMISMNKSFLICFNGEIYNSEFLKAKYLKNINLKSTSDTEILLESYVVAGNRVFNDLEGMYSVFIYDLRRRKATFVRDRFGIKPLYYLLTKDFLIFSSEIKPIIKLNKDNAFNDLAFADFFFKGHLDHDKTFFKNIEIFPAGNYASLNNKELNFNQYWDLKETQSRNNSLQFFEEKIEQLFDRAVKNHLISDRNASLFLSGGTDSSILAQEISKQINYKLHTYTYSFSNSGNFNEEKDAEIISKKLNILNKSVIVDHKYVLNNFDRLVGLVESPITSLRLFGHLKNYETAANDNFKLVFEGHGGDEMFAGYDYNYLFFVLDKYKKKPNHNTIKDLMFSNYYKKVQNQTDLNNLLMTSTFQDGSTTDGVPFVNIDLFNKDFLNKYLKEKFYKTKKKMKNLLKQSQYQDIKNIKLPRNLKYTDRLSMSCGIETRVPYLDHKFFEFCFNIPNNLKFNKGQSRWIFKKTFKNKILKLQKSKKTIVDPQKSWFLNEMRDKFLSEINSIDFKNSDYFDFKNVKKYYLKIFDSKNQSSFNLMQILSTQSFIKKFKKL